MNKAFTILILIIWTSLLITKEYADTIENLAKARSSESNKSAGRGYFCNND